MRRSFDFSSNPERGWNTTSLEYVEHLTRMERMPSMITEAPYFPSASSTLRDRVIQEEWEDQHEQVNHGKQKQSNMVQKKVHFTESVVKDGKGKVYVEEDINVEAEGFIQQKHKIFEMNKWATSKVC